MSVWEGWRAEAKRYEAEADALRERVRVLEGERDEARTIVRDTYWMALRYADGRLSYAVGMCNDAVRKGYTAGWLPVPTEGQHTPQFARDGNAPKYREIASRAVAAEGRVRVLEEALKCLENANEALAASRSPKTYDSILEDGGRDALLALDNARRSARDALRAALGPKEESPMSLGEDDLEVLSYLERTVKRDKQQGGAGLRSTVEMAKFLGLKTWRARRLLEGLASRGLVDCYDAHPLDWRITNAGLEALASQPQEVRDEQ